jgi:16S rRNA (guanine527-N7)-methyltransferase
VNEAFVKAIEDNGRAFGVDVSDDAIIRLSDYYELVQEHNAILHLVAPCAPEEFAIRHVLESLTLLEYLPRHAKFADVGAGAGLPSIPCLLARRDLSASLIESKEKKARFLHSAVAALSLSGRAKVVNKQFEETNPADARFVACRAIDKFTEKLPRLIKWSDGRRLLFFGGPALGKEMQKRGMKITQKLMPFSERRYLFVSGT